MPGHVDHIVDATEYPYVAIRCLDGAVTRKVRPVAPVLALRIPAVLLEVGIHEPLGLTPDRLEDARPRVADADVPRSTAARLDDLAILVVDHGIDAEDSGAAAARFHLIERRECAAQEPAILGLPPRVDDDRFAFAHDPVIPAPHLRFDGLAHRRHVLEVIVVLRWLIRSELAEHPDGGRRRVEDIHAKALCDPPGPTGIRIERHYLIHHARGP